MQRWKLTLEYVGTNFAGWQRQIDVPSIQQSIEESITKFCQQDIQVTVAGRTDAGVHAIGQVCHFDLDYGDRPLDGFSLMKALNYHLLPHPITVVHAEPVHAEFHARFHATNKLYRYHIVQRPAFIVRDKGFVWHFKRPLNAAAMHEAAQSLLGHHDFSTFRDSECQAQSPMKTLDRLDITERPYDDFGGKEIIVETEGRSFLHHQVRNMVGTLTLVGEGKWTTHDLMQALYAKRRDAGGMTAPAEGLYLVRVDYDEE
ncbi:MAG: tRNA pseudouridine(38-40) synthase TruA [Micavibrio sp.]|nr:tRNA pseudouridine(38-40) synthase TruA [Micavibrio sp.]|tara:strand:- start:991 stop:1764 length:774 start_codon:yes stop_codon:yes gene_type:complete